MTRAEATRGKDTAMSWLAVLILASAIFAVLWGTARLLTGAEIPWYERFSVEAMLLWIALTVVSVLLVTVFLGWILFRNPSRRPDRVRKQMLVLGPWVIYLPVLGGTLPAIVGLVSAMVTPFLGGGLIAVIPRLLNEAGVLPHEVSDWIARGIVGYQTYEDSQTRFVVAQAIAAAGLAIMIIGLIQVYRPYREKRLMTKGLYSTVRHPQHLGIALWTFGLALAISGVSGFMMWFTILYLYVLLARREEGQLGQRFGTTYAAYRKATPFMIPFVNIGLPLPASGVLRSTALIAYYAAGLTALILILQRIGVEHGFM